MIDDLSYEEILNKYLSQGYKAVFFDDFNMSQTKQLILRHDIDFDLSHAYEISKKESELGVQSTYFFMMSSDSYNLLSKDNIDFVKKIHRLGHKISLHFDPLVYDDFIEGFKRERNIFEKIFNVNIDIISIHRPNDYFLNYDQQIDGVDHTYMKKFFKDMKYISDSGGSFKYDHPINNIFFEQNENIHLLTHPIWWCYYDKNAIDKLNNFVNYRTEKYRLHIANNCKPYKNYIQER